MEGGADRPTTSATKEKGLVSVLPLALHEEEEEEKEEEDSQVHVR